ncbi:flavin reductase family protein [Streptomyces sp. NPDC013178]|uniref:flavin reductase family protein n=1 Tax=Streptomyces sp. NPDC013178 TaxID=3155118 RepID=UPI0034004BDA
MSRLPVGVAVVSGLVGGRPIGMLVGTLMPVSAAPPIVAYCADPEDPATRLLSTCATTSLSVLPHFALGTYRRFSLPIDDRFRGGDWHESSWGTPVLDAAITVLQLSDLQRVAAGDHVVVLCAVQDVTICAPTEAPLTLFDGRVTRLEAGELAPSGRWRPHFGG